MFLQRFLKAGPARAAGERLYAATVTQARAPALYAQMGAPDTPDGRFEVYTLHVLILLERLRGQSAEASAVAQGLFDAYLSGLDHGLREMAVGDLSVGKTMRKLAEAFYGRGKALDAALAELPDAGEFEALVGRTVFAGVDDADPAPLAAYFVTARDALAQTPLGVLTTGQLAWRAAA